jgi:hypothetical protein
LQSSWYGSYRTALARFVGALFRVWKIIVIMQVLSVLGALMVLAAYGLIQNGIWRELDAGYLALNIAGSVLLGIVAVAERQVGFILLEFAWAGLGIVGVVRAWKARHSPRATG